MTQCYGGMSSRQRQKSVWIASPRAVARFLVFRSTAPNKIDAGRMTTERKPLGLHVDKAPDLAQPSVAVVSVNSAILDEAALLALGEDIGSQDLRLILIKLKENLSQHADRLIQALSQGDLVLAKRTAHDIKGMSMQFGAPSLAEIAKVAELDAKNMEDIPAANLLAAIGAVNSALDAFDAKYLKVGTDQRL